ncbi:MAG: amino acid--tRNA ligase-related protein, partial [Candidatus Odinarchaeia archaeon]
DNPKICQAFDMMISWLEIASGATRIHRRELLEKRIKEKGMRPESFDYHLKVFEWGMPPHAGAGLGLARIIMAITGIENIREAVLFPRDRNRLTP